MIEFDVDMGYLLEHYELDKVVLNDEDYEYEPMEFVPIAATVGAGTLTAEQVRECAKGVYFEGYGDGATHRASGIEETDWQTIADKLNTTMGAGTCHNISKVTDTRGRKVRFVCSECDAWIDSEFIWNHEYSNGESPWVKDCKLNYCPNCGKRIEEEAE